MTGQRASDGRPAVPRSPRATLEHYAAEAAIARQSKKQPTWPPTPERKAQQTTIVYWVGDPDGPGRLGAYRTYEAACAEAGGCAVGWSEIPTRRAEQLFGLDWPSW